MVLYLVMAIGSSATILLKYGADLNQVWHNILYNQIYIVQYFGLIIYIIRMYNVDSYSIIIFYIAINRMYVDKNLPTWQQLSLVLRDGWHTHNSNPTQSMIFFSSEYLSIVIYVFFIRMYIFIIFVFYFFLYCAFILYYKWYYKWSNQLSGLQKKARSKQSIAFV